jgi:hypothetical protein
MSCVVSPPGMPIHACLIDSLMGRLVYLSCYDTFCGPVAADCRLGAIPTVQDHDVAPVDDSDSAGIPARELERGAVGSPVN